MCLLVLIIVSNLLQIPGVRPLADASREGGAFLDNSNEDKNICLVKIYSLLVGRDVVAVLTALGQISGWGEARKCLEVVNEVCLIVVAAAQGKLGPGLRHAFFYGEQDLLEAQNASELLRGESDRLAEKVNETRLA